MKHIHPQLITGSMHCLCRHVRFQEEHSSRVIRGGGREMGVVWGGGRRWYEECQTRADGFIASQSGNPLKKMEEPSFFFKMSRFQERLMQHLRDNPTFVRPEARRNEVIERLVRLHRIPPPLPASHTASPLNLPAASPSPQLHPHPNSHPHPHRDHIVIISLTITPHQQFHL